MFQVQFLILNNSTSNLHLKFVTQSRRKLSEIVIFFLKEKIITVQETVSFEMCVYSNIQQDQMRVY